MITSRSQLPCHWRLLSPELRTEFEPNRNAGGYGLTVVRNVCFLPEGPIVLLNITDDELNRTLAASVMLQHVWQAGYNTTCGWCSTTGSRILAAPPRGAKFIRGNTVHLIPYMGNVFHNYVERVWPHLASRQSPLKETTMQKVDHFLVHRFSDWMVQAKQGNHERETFMLQFRVLAELSPAAKFILVGSEPVCLERLTLDCSPCDRILPAPLDDRQRALAVESYRAAAFGFFGGAVLEPKVAAPPRRLRVAVYGRGDTKRRRVVNVADVVSRLRSWRQPPLEVVVVDDLLRDGSYNQTMGEAVSLFSQLDVLVSVHGANTWATMFMPRGAAVIEIYGPCGPGTWITDVARILRLKHDTSSNPWHDRVQSPLAGNTTECEGFYKTPDFTLDLDKLETALRQIALPSGPADSFPLHWLFNWSF